MRVQVVAGLLVLALGTGCSDHPEEMCTLVGGESGISVTVAAELAPLSRLAIDVCRAGQCREHEVVLRDRRLPGPPTCVGSRRPGRCSAQQAAAGTQQAFGSANVPSGSLDARARYQRSGLSFATPTTSIEALASYPNGPGCEPRVVQLHLELDATGIHQY